MSCKCRACLFCMVCHIGITFIPIFINVYQRPTAHLIGTDGILPDDLHHFVFKFAVFHHFPKSPIRYLYGSICSPRHGIYLIPDFFFEILQFFCIRGFLCLRCPFCKTCSTCRIFLRPAYVLICTYYGIAYS